MCPCQTKYSSNHVSDSVFELPVFDIQSDAPAPGYPNHDDVKIPPSEFANSEGKRRLQSRRAGKSDAFPPFVIEMKECLRYFRNSKCG